jgi:tryptophanyl-tRNA synthetase
MAKFEVTPWEIKGDIDYGKIIKEFGLKLFETVPSKLNDFLLFRRKIIYCHRDFDKIEESINKKKPFVMMTGLMPSGKFHFGHKMVADQIIMYQKLGAKIYVAVADIEAYNSRNPDMAGLRKTAIEEYLTNYVALGLDLKKCDFYFQSERSKDGEKSNSYYALANMLGRHTTFNQVKSIYGDISPAKLSSALLQASDMLHPQLKEFEGKPLPVVVPVGIDQDPHLRLARDVAHKYPNYKFMPLSSTCHMFLPGLKGGKMSSSDENSYIALTDSPEVAAKKIKKFAFSGGRETLEEHRKKGGNPNIDVSFQLLKYGLEEDDEKLEQIYEDYKSGKLLTGELKKYTIEKIQKFLVDHQKKREKAKKEVEKFLS